LIDIGASGIAFHRLALPVRERALQRASVIGDLRSAANECVVSPLAWRLARIRCFFSIAKRYIAIGLRFDDPDLRACRRYSIKRCTGL